ncbi:MAG: hypothetical protein JRJ03_10750 [Deltaproteobacteria bacterium]|nr:hypothetical protein [Deltaproteobacteria bacterium]MBW2065396.1 hypothetical protein [Deltaproteobacteria bacterium]
MKRITEVSEHEANWKGCWEYVLQAGEDLIGALRLKAGHVTQGTAESAHGNWRFRKKWFPREKVIVYQEDSGTKLAVFKTRWGREKGLLEFTDGHVYQWLSKSVWRNKCVFTDAFGEHLLYFRRNSNPLSILAVPKGYSTGTVEITRFGLYMSELPVLMLLGCYLMIIDAI